MDSFFAKLTFTSFIQSIVSTVRITCRLFLDYHHKLILVPDAREKKKHGHLPDIHGGSEPRAQVVPGGNRVGDNFDIIPGQGGEYQGGVEQKDGPGQQDSDHINIRASLTIYISIHFQHGAFNCSSTEFSESLGSY